jgi:3-oxoadipate enol-lactonase
MMAENVDLHYYAIGDGFPLVLIHGWCSDGLSYALQIPLAYKYRLILPDLRGQGKSPKPQTKCTPALLASDVNRLLERLGIEKAVMCGGSFGGMVTLQFALDYPEKVKALILSDTASTSAAASQFMSGCMALLSGPNATEMLKGMISQLASGSGMTNSPAVAMLIEASLERLTDMDPVSLLEVTKGMEGFDVTERLVEIKVPTLIIAGKRDLVVPPQHSEEMHKRIVGSEYVVIDTEHGSPFFRPDEWNREVQSFLESVNY